MVGAEQRPGSEQFAAAGGVNPFDALIEQTRLNIGTISEYCTQWSDMAVFARRSGQPDEVTRTIWNVGLGLDYLAFTERYDQISEGHKIFVREDIPQMLHEESTDQVVLSYEEARLLQMAAAAVNIAYDPGEPEDTPENIQKRTFDFADLEQRVLHGDMPEPGRVVDAEQ